MPENMAKIECPDACSNDVYQTNYMILYMFL